MKMRHLGLLALIATVLATTAWQLLLGSLPIFAFWPLVEPLRWPQAMPHRHATGPRWARPSGCRHGPTS